MKVLKIVFLTVFTVLSLEAIGFLCYKLYDLQNQIAENYNIEQHNSKTLQKAIEGILSTSQ